MTMTDERLAELDAVMANTTKREWGADGLRDNRIVWSGPDTRVCFMAIYPKAHADSLAIVALHNAYADLRAHIEAQAATIARLEAERVFVLGAGECVTNWGTYGGEPCVFLEPLVGAKGVQGEPVQDSEKHDPHVLRSGSVVLVLRGEPVAFLEDIATARAQENTDV